MQSKVCIAVVVSAVTAVAAVAKTQSGGGFVSVADRGSIQLGSPWAAAAETQIEALGGGPLIHIYCRAMPFYRGEVIN